MQPLIGVSTVYTGYNTIEVASVSVQTVKTIQQSGMSNLTANEVAKLFCLFNEHKCDTYFYSVFWIVFLLLSLFKIYMWKNCQEIPFSVFLSLCLFTPDSSPWPICQPLAKRLHTEGNTKGNGKIFFMSMIWLQFTRGMKSVMKDRMDLV